jgi:hypothetical protein
VRGDEARREESVLEDILGGTDTPHPHDRLDLPAALVEVDRRSDPVVVGEGARLPQVLRRARLRSVGGDDAADPTADWSVFSPRPGEKMKRPSGIPSGSRSLVV